MANTPSTRKPVSRARKTTRKTTVRKKRTKKATPAESKDIIEQLSDSARTQFKKLGDKFQEDKDIMPQMSDATREQLKKLGDKLGEATDKGVTVAKDIAERVRHFASEATELTKLKIEIHKLKSSRDRLIFTVGEKLISLYKARKFSNVETTFADDFKKLDDIKTKLSEKEKAVRKISL
jgi:hypothetical protein